MMYASLSLGKCEEEWNKKKKTFLKKEKRKQRKKGGHDYVDMQRFEWNPEIFIGEKNNKANEI